MLREVNGEVGYDVAYADCDACVDVSVLELGPQESSEEQRCAKRSR